MKQLRALSLAALLVFLSTPLLAVEEDFKIEHTAAEDGSSQYHMQVPQDMATDFLNNLLPSLDEPTQRTRGRELAQQWNQFNTYFSGTGNTAPGNLPTYFGRAPGPCPLQAAGHTEKCKARACDMSPAIRAIKLKIMLWNKRVDEYLELNNCAQYPGTVWVYDLDAGNLRMGGIYLNLAQQAGTDDVAYAGKAFETDPNTNFKSETMFFNQFRMTLTVSEVQLDADLRIDIQNLRMKSPIGFTLTKNGVGVTLAKSRQTISGSEHAISFRSILTFRANKACKQMSPPTPGVADANYDTTCVYRSDVSRSGYYRSATTRTESFLEGVVYDINLPRVNGANTNPTAAYDASACQFDFTNEYASQSPSSNKKLNLGLNLDIGAMCSVLGLDICRAVLNWILNLIVGLILQGILCQMFNQMFFLMNAAGNAPTDQPGLINIGVQNVYKFFKKYVEKPLSTKEDADLSEDVTVPNMFGAAGYTWPRANCQATGYCPYPDAVDFNNSGIFKSISLGLNSILGNVSTTAGYTDKLVIVEVIDILTGNKKGDLPIGICPPGNTGTCTMGYCAGTCDGDIKDELMLADYPRVTWTGQPVFDGQIQLNGLLFKHINTIKKLNLLDNGFVDAQTTSAVYTHTLKNSIVMERFGMQMKLVITLTDGSWVHRPRQQIVSPANKRSIYMNSDIYVEVKDITINADLFVLLEGGRLGDKFIGSIFGNWPKGSFTKRLHCAAYGLDYVQIPRLQLAATLDKLQFTDFMGDLAAVIQQGTAVFDLGYRTATNLYLKFLADNWVRPMINDYLKDNTYDGPCGTRNPFITPSTPNANCTRPQSKDKCEIGYPYYFANNDINRYLNFYNSKVWNVVKGVVNDLVGGIPVRTGSASINQLIDVYMEMYIPVLVNNNISVVKVPNNQANKEMGNLDFPGNAIEIRSNKSTDNFFRLSQFTVRNIETIHELSVYPTQQSQPREFSVYFKIGGGKIWDRTNNQYITNGNLFFRFHLATEVTVPVAGVMKTYAEDQADFALEFGNVTFNANIYALLNQNDVLDLRFGDFNKLGCILSLVDEFELRQLLIAFQSFKFNIKREEGWRHRTEARCGAGRGWNVVNTNPNFVSTIEMMVTGCHPNRIVRFSDSLDYLAWETLWWGAKVNNMLKYIFNGVSAVAKKTVNAFTLWNPPTIGCADHKVGGGGFLSDLINSTKNATNEAGEAVSFWSQLTADQLNPRFPQYPKGTCSLGPPECQINYGNPTHVSAQIGLPANSAAQTLASCQALPNGNKAGACWETRVKDDENRIDMRDNFIVREVQKFVTGSGQKLVVDALNALATSGASNLTNVLKSYANNTMLPNGRGRCNNVINGEASYCIDIDADLTLLGVSAFSNSDFIPGLEVAAKRLKVLNLHTFDANPESFNLLFNYIPDQYRGTPEYTHAMYTLAHRIMFGSQTHGYLDVNVDLEVTVAREFLDFSVFNTTAGKERVTDNINLGFKFADFDLQILSTTAFNASRILEVPFYYLLDPMSPERCLFSVFYENGLYLPQLQLQIADLIGPEVTISPKTPNLVAPTQANIFSKGVGYLITSTIEILFQLTKSDIPDMTQGPLRSYVNRVLGDLVLKSRDAAGPGSCPQPASCGPPNSMCHYQKFNDTSFAKILDIVNGNVGGNPVKTSILDINSLVNMGMKYAALDPNGPLLLGPNVDKVSNPEVGTWFIDSLFDFASGPSQISIKNVGIKGLDSIYKLRLDTFSQAPYQLGLSVEIGNGTMLDGSKLVPEPFQAEPLTLQVEVDMVVIAQRPGANPQAPKIPETLADNEFRVELRFAGINVTSFQQVLANRTDLFQLSITQVTKTQCVMAFIDKITLETFSVQIADFDVHVYNVRNANNACGNDYCKIGKAMDLLRGEAEQTNAYAPPQSSKPLSMLNVILSNVGTLVEDAVNTATIFNQTLYKCEVQKMVFQISSGVYTKNHSETLINHLLRNVTGILSNPRPKVTDDFTAITVQSTRANKPATKTQFVKDVIASAQYAFGTGVKDGTVVLTIGSVCDTLKMNAAFRPVCNMALGDKALAADLSDTLAGWTSGNYLNYIDAKVPPSYFEGDVVIDYEKDTYYDVRTSAIASGVSSYFSKSVEALEDLLKVIANKTDILRVEADGTVTLAANITELMLMADDMIFSGKTCEGEEKEAAFKFADFLVENNDIIPHLRVLPGLLEIRNFGSFSEITLFKPYKIGPNPEDQARFTTQQQFGWRRPGQPMNISVNLDIFYDIGLTDPAQGFNTGVIGKESIEINLAIIDLYVQVLALMAVDTTALGYVRLGDFLNVDAAQKFLRNCNALTCLMTGIFDGGLSVPQLSINVTDIIGPTFTTTGNLFSPGMEAFIDAVMEMGVQLFRDDLTSLTQGPLRQTINNKLSKFLGDAKVPGACPERRNYTRDYPYGPNFCSHNDTTGVSPVLTQTAAACASKQRALNGPTCEWSPPDVAQMDETTVACFYTKASKDLNFETAVALTDLKNFINSSLLNPDSAMYINNVLGAFASSLKTGMFQINDYPLKYNGGSYGTATLGVGNFKLTGLNTVDTLLIFDNAPYGPGGDSSFENGPEYEALIAPTNRRMLQGRGRELAESKSFSYYENRFTTRSAIGFTGPFTMSMRIYMEFTDMFEPSADMDPDQPLVNDVTLSLTLYDFDLAIDLLMLINIPRLMDLQIRSIGTIYELPCILEIFEDNGLIPVQFNMTYGRVGYSFCVTPAADGGTGRVDSPMLSALKLICLTDVTSAELADTVARQLQSMTDYAIRMLASSELQNFLNTQISTANTQCVAIKTGDLTLPDFDASKKEHTDAASALGIAGLSLIFATGVVFALLVPVHFRRRDELMKRALLDAHERGAQGKSKDEFELAERRLRPVFFHPTMPFLVKYGVLVAIAFNVVCFATANFAAVGCRVELKLSLAGSTTKPIILLAFTLATSVNDMWNSGAYPLAIIIALASGGWPYAKQILLLFSWFAPSTILHPLSRGRLLEILDSLGKFSMIDIYVLLVMMVAFRFYITSTMVGGLTLLPPSVVEVDVLVTADWGMYGFCLGAMGSLLVNHVMIWYNRKAIRADEDFQDAILGTLVKDLRTPRIPLSKHRFNVLDAEGRPYRFSPVVRIFVVFSLAITFIMMIVACVLPTIKFTFRGVAGIAFNLIDPELGSNTQSAMSIGVAIIDGVRQDAQSIIGVIFLQILYILFSLVLPLALVIVLLVIWVVPLTLREQNLLYFLAEVLSAWEASIVLLITFVAAVLQISVLAAFIVDSATYGLCNGIEGQLAKIFPDPLDAKCFDVVVTLTELSGTLWFACISMIVFCGYAFRLIEAAIQDRELAMRRKPPHSPGQMTGCQGFYVRRSLEAFGPSQIQDGGNVANAFAQQQGAFSGVNSMQIQNPVLAREMDSNSQFSPHQSSNPMFSGPASVKFNNHASIDV